MIASIFFLPSLFPGSSLLRLLQLCNFDFSSRRLELPIHSFFCDRSCLVGFRWIATMKLIPILAELVRYLDTVDSEQVETANCFTVSSGSPYSFSDRLMAINPNLWMSYRVCLRTISFPPLSVVSWRIMFRSTDKSRNAKYGLAVYGI
ncbi:unnamed protein product [Dovyalis caffra]|uniref:Uncharacterized protein n=1 Tax=Dovyalis caffra TaxID=77055 RepID=A0AAV1SHE5_9ROSI|nr:unnamed protein product [Dovyalis caffra]